tara:strand:+ start:194 stop:367 length:174 start_codon:yes stop_codon:yes gene_type:complete
VSKGKGKNMGENRGGLGAVGLLKMDFLWDALAGGVGAMQSLYIYNIIIFTYSPLGYY